MIPATQKSTPMNHIHLDFSRHSKERSSRPPLEELQPRRSGVLVAAPEAAVRAEMLVALRGAGIAAEAVATCEQVLAVVEAAPSSGALPEVLVVDVRILNEARGRLLDALEAMGGTDSLLVILSGLWPRGYFPDWLEPLNCLHEPVPMPVFVEEVARLASPASVRVPPAL